jgi:hypothetical protein
MLFEQGRRRLAVAAAELLDRVVRIGGRLVHESPYILHPRAGQEAGPENGNCNCQGRSRVLGGPCRHHAWS